MVESVSVIIPTIQKNLDILYKLVLLLQADKCVAEIIIINNSPKNLPVKFYIDKVRILKAPTNLYVNKSWNFGISNAYNDTFLIINDDILPIKNFCSKIIKSKILEEGDTGLIGICPQFINQYQLDSQKEIDVPASKNVKLELKKMDNYLFTGDWGSAFLGKKNNYYAIPDDLKIIYGDNYLLYKNLSQKKINYQICGLPFNHVHSLSSSSSEFGSIVSSDIANSKKYFPQK